MLLVMVVLLDLTSTAQRWYARALIAKYDPGEVVGAMGGVRGADATSNARFLSRWVPNSSQIVANPTCAPPTPPDPLGPYNRGFDYYLSIQRAKQHP